MVLNAIQRGFFDASFEFFIIDFLVAVEISDSEGFLEFFFHFLERPTFDFFVDADIAVLVKFFF